MSKSKQSRGWVMTLPVEDYDEAAVRRGLEGFPFVAQQEIGGETGYRHWQVYVEASSGSRFSTWKRKFPKGHMEPRAGSKRQAYEYCTKEETVVPGTRISSGTIDLDGKSGVGRGHRTDIEALHRAIVEEGRSVEELLLESPAAMRMSAALREVEAARDREQARSELRTVHVEYWHGATGVGKTRRLWDRYGADAFFVTDYSHPFDNYSGQPVLVLDEFTGQFPIRQMLQLLDCYPVELPARYRNRYACYSTVVIVSNEPLESLYLKDQKDAPRRWEAFCRRIDAVREIVGKEPPVGMFSELVQTINDLEAGRHREE